MSTLELEGIKLNYNAADENNCLTVYLTGYLDTINSTKVTPFLNKIPLKEKGISKIILNMEGLTYVSSTGIGSLTSLLITCKKLDIELELINLQKKIYDVILLLGFTSFFSIKEKL